METSQTINAMQGMHYLHIYVINKLLSIGHIHAHKLVGTHYMLAGMGLYAEVGLLSPGPEPFATKACY